MPVLSKLWHQRACYLGTSGSKHIAVEDLVEDIGPCLVGS